ncbi:MAG: hypothetical protein ACOYOV_15955 [Bacteroidales bacterium]
MTTIYKFFSAGILYVFGISNNPLLNEKDRFAKRSDEEELRKDWERVGMYIKNAYESEKQQSSKEPTTSY